MLGCVKFKYLKSIFYKSNLANSSNYDISRNEPHVHVPGSPPKLRQFGFKEISAYTGATWSCNMSYERKFCGLSEYVQFRNVRLIIKSPLRF